MRSVFVRVWVLTWRERFPLIGLGFLTLLLPPAVFAVPQGVPQGALKGPNEHEQSPPPSGPAQPNAGNPTPLGVLIEEARKNVRRILRPAKNAFQHGLILTNQLVMHRDFAKNFGALELRLEQVPLIALTGRVMRRGLFFYLLKQGRILLKNS